VWHLCRLRNSDPHSFLFSVFCFRASLMAAFSLGLAYGPRATPVDVVNPAPGPQTDTGPQHARCENRLFFSILMLAGDERTSRCPVQITATQIPCVSMTNTRTHIGTQIRLARYTLIVVYREIHTRYTRDTHWLCVSLSVTHEITIHTHTHCVCLSSRDTH
jgi:hypothetical protein